jgi:hypothetical protein
MPRLTTGAKWTYGWVMVSQRREVVIPPDAWAAFGFQAGDEALFIRGSRRSGGFGLSNPARMATSTLGRGELSPRFLARGVFGHRQVIVPFEVGVGPGDRLLTVLGSRYALGFVARGRIFNEALEYKGNLYVYG